MTRTITTAGGLPGPVIALPSDTLSSTIEIPRFDPALGYLVSAGIRFGGRVQADIWLMAANPVLPTQPIGSASLLSVTVFSAGQNAPSFETTPLSIRATDQAQIPSTGQITATLFEEGLTALVPLGDLTRGIGTGSFTVDARWAGAFEAFPVGGVSDGGGRLFFAAEVVWSYLALADAIRGTNGNDRLEALATGSILEGEGGNDTLIGSGSEDVLFGGIGNDVIEGRAGNDTIYGGGDGTNQLFGNDGNDLVFAGTGGDFIGGGAGNDTVRGGAGNDTIYGGLGDDNIGGGAGNDLIFGAAGANIIWGGLGNDTVHGGTGSDTIYGGGNGTNQLFGNDGNDLIFAGSGGDFIGGGAGNDTIRGGDGADTIYGGLSNDDLAGGAGNDVIFGSTGNNTIWGGLGNDTIHGGTGKDVMNGGPGADTFVFASAAHIGIGLGRDVISGFQSGVDQIDLRALNTTFNGTAGVLGGGQASFFYFAASGLLIGDQNGNGAADWVLELAGAPTVTAGDFLL